MTNLAIIAHFISDDNNNLIFVGNHSENFTNDLISNFQNPQVSYVITNDFLKLNFNYNDDTSIMIMDSEISKLLIHSSTYDSNTDEADFMLAKRIANNLASNKMILNLSEVGSEQLNTFIEVLDFEKGEFDYIIIDNIIAIIADPEFIED